LAEYRAGHGKLDQQYRRHSRQIANKTSAAMSILCTVCMHICTWHDSNSSTETLPMAELEKSCDWKDPAGVKVSFRYSRAVK